MNLDFENLTTVKKRLAIFGSGAGSNAENCINFFKQHNKIEVALIVTNRKDAGIAAIAKSNHIACEIINSKTNDYLTNLIELLKSAKIDYILLAGYLALVPEGLIKVYRNKIYNVHPALLPNYGGKGMYGKNVHRAVFENHDKESGITIHEVDEAYDRGRILYQQSVVLEEPITPESIERQVRSLEIRVLPEVVEKLLLNN